MVEYRAGAHVEPHRHANEQIAWLLRARWRFRFGTEQGVCGPGLVTPGRSNRGVAYSSKGDQDRAIADFNEAIQLDPKYALAFASRAFAYASKRDNDRAIADFNEAIRLDPKNARAFCYRGELKRQINDATSGADIKKARQLGKNC